MPCTETDVTPGLLAELALDDHEGHAFVGELDGVRVAQLVRATRRRTPAAAAVSRNCARAAAIYQL